MLVDEDHPLVNFYFEWKIFESGKYRFKVEAVSHNSAMHRATLRLMGKRQLKCTRYINGPYTELRNTLTAIKVERHDA